MPCSPVSDFLRDLPSRDRDNFTRLSSEAGGSPNGHQSVRRSTVYVPTKDFPSEQIIITEKTNILLRFLHQQWEKKAGTKRRDTSEAGTDLTDTSERKKARLDSPNTPGNNSQPPPSTLNRYNEI
uniref:DET1- and DDB1-associated protein 1 n=1 Tax=Caligus rogercresseyi TaxID=217165 RepID=C1BPD3_CALRO|nr:DET1- and DDB1-associated protein 1 [Caligus rogercresseyi]